MSLGSLQFHRAAGALHLGLTGHCRAMGGGFPGRGFILRARRERH